MATRPLEELITDRTLADIKNKTAKGNFNASDFNRIEEWERYLADLLNEYGYHINIVTKTDWQVGWGRENMFSNIARIKNNLQALKNEYYAFSTTPNVPSPLDTSINYIKLNNIEKILIDLNYLIEKMSISFRYSGYFISGEDLGLIDVN